MYLQVDNETFNTWEDNTNTCCVREEMENEER